MIWCEVFADRTNCEYATCEVCGEYPALNLICGECKDDFEGPFCLKHWREEIDKQFNLLYKKLDDENWGSSPETRREWCEMCKTVNLKIKTLRHQDFTYDTCWDCYDKYSEK